MPILIEHPIKVVIGEIRTKDIEHGHAGTPIGYAGAQLCSHSFCSHGFTPENCSHFAHHTGIDLGDLDLNADHTPVAPPAPMGSQCFTLYT